MNKHSSKFENLRELILKDERYATAKERRAPLLKLMTTLGDEKKNCFSCEGFCCTYAHNSMLVTPLEALDAFDYLYSRGQFTDEVIESVRSCIKEFRLDNELVIGRGREFRRNYTCPFFNNGPKGCGISPEQKPYGCLGFNPLEVGVSTRGSCTSYLDVLIERDESSQSLEIELNDLIKEKFEIYWDKKNLPVAINELVLKFFN